MLSHRRLWSLAVLFLFGSLLSCSSGSSSNSGGSGNPGTPVVAADFTLTASPSTVALVQGAAGQTVTLSATGNATFSGNVSVSATGLPTGVTLTPSTLSLASGTPGTVTISAGAGASPGSATITFTGTAGSTSHTVTVTVTIAPPPDFTLVVAPASVTAAAGGAPAQVSVRADSVNGFTGNIGVAVSGLPTGVTASPSPLTLSPGVAGTISLTAGAGALASTGNVTFTATAGALSHTATTSLTVQSALTTSAPDVTTYHYNIARDGLNAQETILTPANVNAAQFGLINVLSADGRVDAEPLFLTNVAINGSAHNVLYVASEHGTVYAYDADTGSLLWQTSLIPSGETTSDARSCNQVSPEIGITSTPVIDRAAGKIFLVAMSKTAGNVYHQRLHALNLLTGAEVTGSPTEITASYPGTGAGSSNGVVPFAPSQYAERAALLLYNGTIYTGWTSHCDIDPYTGWVIAFNENTLQQTSALNLTPNGSRGSIWMSGNGLAADSNGIYFADANGVFDTDLDSRGFPIHQNFGNALIRLGTGSTLAIADYFAAYNTVSLSNSDLDLGSGGAILLPAMKDAGGATRRLIVAAGKFGNIIIADRDNMGHFNPSTLSPDSNVYQEVGGQINNGLFGSPAFFNGTLYIGGANGSMRALPFLDARMATTPSSRTSATFSFPGTTPSVSANGTSNGIVWTLNSNPSTNAILHAYDPSNLANEYYNSTQAPNNRDSFGLGNKYITPLIVNGKVYVGTPSGVAVFGLLGH